MKATMENKSPEIPAKRGRASWRPAKKLDIVNKAPGFRYRYVSVDYTNLQKKLAEGWQFVNPSTGIPGQTAPSAREVSDGRQLDSIQKLRELVLMALPEDIALERDAYHSGKTRHRARALEDSLQADLSKAALNTGVKQSAVAHGSIEIGHKT